MQYHVYIINNTSTGKVYVGLTQDTYFRFNVHRSELRRGKHSNPGLQADYKADPTCWTYYVIESFEATADEARVIEKEWVNAFPDAYNLLGRKGAKVRRSGKPGCLAKRCTIDGETIYQSQRQLILALGQGRNGRAHPNFRYV